MRIATFRTDGAAPGAGVVEGGEIVTVGTDVTTLLERDDLRRRRASATRWTP